MSLQHWSYAAMLAARPAGTVPPGRRSRCPDPPYARPPVGGERTMSLQHWSYVAMLAFCLLGTLPLVPAFGLAVLRQPERLLRTIGLAVSPCLLWDLYATQAGHWWFDAAQTLPWRAAGLPFEE